MWGFYTLQDMARQLTKQQKIDLAKKIIAEGEAKVFTSLNQQNTPKKEKLKRNNWDDL